MSGEVLAMANAATKTLETAIEDYKRAALVDRLERAIESAATKIAATPPNQSGTGQ